MAKRRVAGPGRGWHVYDRATARQRAIDGYLTFRSELRGALRAGTPAELRAVLRGWATRHDRTLAPLVAQPDWMLEPVIRRMVLADPQLADLHPGARAWLEQHAAARLGGATGRPGGLGRLAEAG